MAAKLILERVLTKENIDETINKYKVMLRDIPLKIDSSNLIELLSKLKREKINAGPYPHVTLFESTNRIMTDLVILYGVRELLSGTIPDFQFAEYSVEYGNEHNNDNDIHAELNGQILKGEAFNVAPSFFQGKKSTMLKKLRSGNQPNDYLLIMYNSDAVKADYQYEKKENEYHLPVNIDI